MTTDPLAIKRGDLEGLALLCYVPFRRSARHFINEESRALSLAEVLPTLGAEFAERMVRVLGWCFQ